MKQAGGLIDNFDKNKRRQLTLWREIACSLVLFGLVLVITGLGDLAFKPVWEQICDEDDGGDFNEDDINSDPSPLKTVYKSVSQWGKKAPAPFLYSRVDQANSLVCSY